MISWWIFVPMLKNRKIASYRRIYMHLLHAHVRGGRMAQDRSLLAKHGCKTESKLQEVELGVATQRTRHAIQTTLGETNMIQ